MKRYHIYLLFLTLTFLSCSSNPFPSNGDGDKDWTSFRGDATLSGYSRHSLPEHPTLLWSYKGDKRTLASPVVLDGTCYWCDTKGRLLGVDLQGQKVYERDLSTHVEATALIRDSILYIGRIDGRLEAFSLTTNDSLWSFETEGQISASPNVVQFQGREALMVGSYDNFMYCVDKETGKEINHFPSGYYINGAAAVWQNSVIFGGCDQLVRIIDCQTGKQTDSLLLDSYIPASPALAGNHAYFADYGGDVYELTLADGKISEWRKLVTASDENGQMTAVPAVNEDAVFVYSDLQHLSAFSRKDGQQLWKYLMKGSLGESSPVVTDDHVLTCTKTGIISILDAKTGQMKWEYDTGEQIVGSPAVIENHFFILTAKGTLLCFGNLQ